MQGRAAAELLVAKSLNVTFVIALRREIIARETHAASSQLELPPLPPLPLHLPSLPLPLPLPRLQLLLLLCLFQTLRLAMPLATKVITQCEVVVIFLEAEEADRTAKSTMTIAATGPT